MSNFLYQIDGKIANILTKCRSAQRCPLCHRLQSEFMNPDLDFEILEDFEKFGLSLLHFGTNAVKGILKVASQIDFRQHRCTDQFKNMRDTRAKKNVRLLWNKFSINVKSFYTVDGHIITLKLRIFLKFKE